VAAADLTAGTRLTAEDLRVVGWPAGLAPSGVVTAVSALVGRTLATAVGRGEALTGLRVVGPALAAAVERDGRIAVPVRLADPDVAALLRPGDRIDLVSATAGAADPVGAVTGAPQAVVVAADATVVPAPTATPDGGLVGGRGAAGGSLVVIAVTRSEALGLARAAVLGPLSVLLVG
jgi:Flp pilus assembly protein CpaB